MSKEYQKQYRATHKEKSKQYNAEYNAEHKEENKEYNKQWVLDHKEENKEYNKQWHLDNKEEIKQYKKQWVSDHREYQNQYVKNRCQTDPGFKISVGLRTRFYNVIIKECKIESAIELLGCPVDECRDKLKAKSKPEMTWENHGKVWEIDHIRPISSFDLMDFEQQKLCFHYSNMQPLFKTTEIARSFGYMDEIGNRNKGNKILYG